MKKTDILSLRAIAVLATAILTATPQHALEAARSDGGDGFTIWVREGRYFLEHPLELTAADSGLSIRAFPDEKVVFSGATDLARLSWDTYAGNSHIHVAAVRAAWALTSCSSISRIRCWHSIRTIPRGAAGLLYYYPAAGVELTTCTVEAAVNTDLVTITGTDSTHPAGEHYTGRHHLFRH